MDNVCCHLCVTLGKALEADGVGSPALIHDVNRCTKQIQFSWGRQRIVTPGNKFFTSSSSRSRLCVVETKPSDQTVETRPNQFCHTMQHATLGTLLHDFKGVKVSLNTTRWLVQYDSLIFGLVGSRSTFCILKLYSAFSTTGGWCASFSIPSHAFFVHFLMIFHHILVWFT